MEDRLGEVVREDQSLVRLVHRGRTAELEDRAGRMEVDREGLVGPVDRASSPCCLPVEAYPDAVEAFHPDREGQADQVVAEPDPDPDQVYHRSEVGGHHGAADHPPQTPSAGLAQEQEGAHDPVADPSALGFQTFQQPL